MSKKRDLVLPNCNLLKTLSNIYFECLPRWVRKIIGPLLEPAYFFSYRIYSIVSDFFPPMSLLKENGNSNCPKLTMLLAGRGGVSQFFLDRIYPAEFKGTPQSRRTIWRIPFIDKSQVNAIVIEGDRCFSQFLSRRGFIPIPEWVLFTSDISMPVEEIIRRLKKSEEDNLRKIMKYQYLCEVGSDRERLRFFYHKMYLPYVVSRYGKSSLLASFGYMENLFQKGELLLIKRQTEYISGVLITTATSPPVVAFLGVRDGRKDLVRLGAISALYYYSILWAKEKGYTELDFGHCRPFLNDGVLLYKKRWGMRIQRSQKKHRMLYLSMGRLNPHLEQFFINNPLVYEDRGQLKGLLFMQRIDSLKKEEGENLKRKYAITGLKGFTVIPIEAPAIEPSN